MSERVQLALISIVLLLIIGFAETFLSTKYRQLSYRAKILTEQLKQNDLHQNQQESKLHHELEILELLKEPALQGFKKALPNDIPAVKFNSDKNNQDQRFVQTR